MQANEALPARLEKAGITVKVEQISSGKVLQFFVVFCREGKQQKETFTSANEARLRAQSVLEELLKET